jgi:hypothetical protein
MGWNEAAYEVLGGSDELTKARHELAVLEGRIGGPLPEAVHEWYLLGGDRRLASISPNSVTLTQDFTSRTVGRFLDNGYLLLETDSQHCCRWVVVTSAAYGDPPVYLIDPDDDACATRSRYAASFSDYAFTAAWDATLWAGELSAAFDHPLPSNALDALNLRLTALPVTHGWAMNQGCDAVYRFGGAAKVAVAVAGSTALWSAIVAPSPAMRDTFARLIGATPDS